METDREQDGWVNSVHRVVIERASFVKKRDEWVLAPRVVDLIINYDRDGKRVDESYGANVVFSSALSGGGINKRDENGGVTEHEWYEDGHLQFRQTFRYDEEGRKVEDESYNPEGKLIGKTKYKYDAHGKAVEASQYDPDETLLSRLAYTNEYDAKGNLIQQFVERWTNVNGDLIHDPLFVIYYAITYY